MNYQSMITPSICIADQPTESDLRDLDAQGYVGIVNLRNEGEPEQPLSVAAEGELVSSLGLEYLHIPVGGAISPGGVEKLVAFLDKHSGEKVLVHCRKGGRAAAMVLIVEALANGWTAAEAFEKGPRMGLQVDGGLRNLVELALQKS
ncbi:MAG: sulfur transferase domain-containing protein [Isosphaeraceae bacterium]|nr:sulfur transferase domain-containing protein [Isosphaeraceae bacterium]